jgi:protease I
MTAELKGKKVAILATDGFEEAELMEPKRVLEESGARVEVLAPHDGEIQALKGGEKTRRVRVSKPVSEATVSEYDGLVLPGGVVNADHLRLDDHAVDFVRGAVRSGLPVAGICHGLWALVEAGAVRGRTLTSYPSLKTDIRNAGGTWVDREVVVEDGIVSSRRVDDLPAFCAAMVKEFAAGRRARATKAA